MIEKSGTVVVDQLMATETLAKVMDMEPKKVLRMPDRTPGFPRPYHVSHRVIRWKAAEYQAWVDGLVKAAAPADPEPHEEPKPGKRRRRVTPI